ncbi:unnamed protein product [Menidia menidia]|uniref:(Atlantic silverside) hypothetical protein n=1 Tax=Menidia menidia TaxID=238744 RepID=A0A8S4AF74_9TELE|nr:unnamed protein product [Menidia menidia]
MKEIKVTAHLEGLCFLRLRGSTMQHTRMELQTLISVRKRIMVVIFFYMTLDIEMILAACCFIFWVVDFSTGSSPSEQVHQTPADALYKPGDTAVIHCSHTVDNFERICWYKQSNNQLQLLGYMDMIFGRPEESVNVKINGSAEKGQICTLIVEELNVNGNAVYFCAAGYHSAVCLCTPPQKHSNINITEPTVKILRPAQKEIRNKRDDAEKKTLVCAATRFYPDHVSIYWQINGADATDGVATDHAAVQGNDSFYRITSRLRVPAQKWFSSKTKFTCAVRFFNGSAYNWSNKTISGDNVGYMRLTQNAKLSYTVIIVKSCIYGAFVCFLVLKLQISGRKQNKREQS